MAIIGGGLALEAICVYAIHWQGQHSRGNTISIPDDIIGGWIRDAEASGDIKNLPGYGKPLNLDDDRNIPQEYRLVSRILKNAGITPPEVQFLKEIAELRKQVAKETDTAKQQVLQLQIRKIQLKLDLALDKLKRSNYPCR